MSRRNATLRSTPWLIAIVSLGAWTVSSLAGRFTVFGPSRRATVARPRTWFPSPHSSAPPRQHKQHERLAMFPIDSSFFTAVEVFDGSAIVDPIVVSSVFWTSLQAKIVTFVLGQLLATAAFCILLSVASTQMSKAADFVASKLFDTGQSNNSNTIRVPRGLRDDTVNGMRSPQTRMIQPDFGKLLVCIAIDVIGTSSELLPVLGELTDVVSAPIAGLILRSLFGGSNIVFFLEFTEEILPFTDILPLATICWVVDTFFSETDLAKLLQLGQYRSMVAATNDGVKSTDRSVIDVKKLD